MSVFKPISWGECRTWDDVITPEEKVKISGLEKKLKGNKCLCLRKEGKYFYYCGAKVPNPENKRIEHYNPIYLNHCNVLKLGFCCMTNFENCPTYVDYTKRTKK